MISSAGHDVTRGTAIVTFGAQKATRNRSVERFDSIRIRERDISFGKHTLLLPRRVSLRHDATRAFAGSWVVRVARPSTWDRGFPAVWEDHRPKTYAYGPIREGGTLSSCAYTCPIRKYPSMPP